MSGEEKKSLKEFQIIFAGEPRCGIYNTEFAQILIAAGQNKAARNHLERAIALTSDFEPARKLLESLDKQDKGLPPTVEKKGQLIWGCWQNQRHSKATHGKAMGS